MIFPAVECQISFFYRMTRMILKMKVTMNTWWQKKTKSQTMIQMNISFEAQVKLIPNFGDNLDESLGKGNATCCFTVGCSCDGLAKQDVMSQKVKTQVAGNSSLIFLNLVGFNLTCQFNCITLRWWLLLSTAICILLGPRWFCVETTQHRLGPK